MCLDCNRAGVSHPALRQVGTVEQAAVARDVLLENMSTRVFVNSNELFAEFRREYGEICQRRLWLTLAWLIKAGLVIKRPADKDRLEYDGWRFEYKRAKHEPKGDTDQPAIPSSGDHLGVVGV